MPRKSLFDEYIPSTGSAIPKKDIELETMESDMEDTEQLIDVTEDSKNEPSLSRQTNVPRSTKTLLNFAGSVEHADSMIRR